MDTSIQEHAEDAAGLLRALGIAPAAVVGASLGALIALELLLRHPDLVRRASLLDPGPVDSAIPDRLEKMAVPEDIRAAIASGRHQEGFEALLRDLGAGDAIDPATQRRVLGNADIFFTQYFFGRKHRLELRHPVVCDAQNDGDVLHFTRV